MTNNASVSFCSKNCTRATGGNDRVAAILREKLSAMMRLNNMIESADVKATRPKDVRNIREP